MLMLKSIVKDYKKKKSKNSFNQNRMPDHFMMEGS